tara:strand:- start:43469 stop:43807 length:339 start_codon:yes stop_codon:yes gene_type:complete
MKNLIKVIALSTVLTSGFVAAQEQTVSTPQKSMETSVKNKSVDKKTELSSAAQQVIQSIENYPNTDLKVTVVGSTATVSGTVEKEMDKEVIIKALESLQDFDRVESDIKLSE